MSRSLAQLPVAGLEATKTHCPYCAFQCGMSVSGGDGRDFTVLADPDFPVNRGQMCIKGFTSASLLDHPARLLEPKLRTKSGELAPVDWDTALDFVAEGLRSLRDR